MTLDHPTEALAMYAAAAWLAAQLVFLAGLFAGQVVTTRRIPIIVRTLLAHIPPERLPMALADIAAAFERLHGFRHPSAP